MNCTSCGIVLDSRATFCPNCGATVPDPFLGQTVGAWTVEKRIAIGTFGSIYRASNAEGEQAAVKLMHRELAADTNLVERFRQEGSVMKQLGSAHIVRTFDYGEHEGLPYIVMELLTGETVLDRLRITRPLPWHQAFAIGKGVCEALEAAHAVGVVHRDLKPGNIFVATGESVKVLDFGIAKILSNSSVGDPKELTIMGTAVGTVEYMAPEQLMGGRADARTDIYTLGVVLYEMVVGRRPYNAAGLELLTEQLSRQPAKPSERHPSLPAVVDDVLMRCLAADVDDRYQSAREMRDALDGALQAQPKVEAETVIEPPRPLPSSFTPDTWDVRKANAPSRLPLVFVAIAIVAIGALVVAFLYA
jgi:serine/threonine-protein kinase